MNQTIPSTRSRIMAAIKGKDTKPELTIRKALFARGLRYRIHNRGLPGSPDVVFAQFRAVVLVEGCFWHGHDCGHVRIPAAEYWRKKIHRNMDRDRANIALLVADGWRVCRIWECALKNRKVDEILALSARVEEWLRGNTQTAEFFLKKI